MASSRTETPNPTPPPNPINPPPSSEPTGAFDRFISRAKFLTGIGVSEEQRANDITLALCRKCDKMKNELMQFSPSVVFMLKHLELAGHPVPKENIFCQPCGPIQPPPPPPPSTPTGDTDKDTATPATPPPPFQHTGGFMPAHGAILLCAGRFNGRAHMEDTIVHELVHMYDHAKFEVDWKNLRHVACSEIRANSLSGDCRFGREIRRAHFSISKQHQACVRRRAVLSVAAVPSCPDVATAERAVNEVWASCFADTRPFDEIY